MDFFIPKTYKKQQISIRIDQDMLNKIDELSEKNEISRSELINQCINYALDKISDNSLLDNVKENVGGKSQ